MWKGLLFRVAAVLLGLAPLAACELALRAFDIGRPTDYDDPFVGFSSIHPLFVRDANSSRYEIPPSRLSHFQPESFAADKPSGEFRIFVLGGSTVQGRPWGIETSFTTWLELSLNAADPSRRYEVVNCGGVSYATYRLVPVMEEILQYQPDLVIFCEGHNEFLEDRSYEPVKSLPPALAWPQRQIARLRTYTLLRQGILRITGQARQPPEGRQILGPEADARLDWEGGLAKYRRDDAWQAAVIRHFEFNLRRIADIAEAADVPLVFVSPVSNLEWGPFKSEHRAGLSTAEAREFESLMNQAREHYGDNLPKALKLLRLAAEIDDQYAVVHYEIGMCLRELAPGPEARDALLRARELDVCPLRMLEPMRRIMRQVASETDTPLVDADAVIAAESRSGYPDNQWLVDHVHPTIEGHQLVADAIADKLVELGRLRPVAAWKPNRELVYRQHLDQLPHAYFEHGKQRMTAEQGWARGLVTRRRPADAPRPSAESVQ